MLFLPALKILQTQPGAVNEATHPSHTSVHFSRFVRYHIAVWFESGERLKNHKKISPDPWLRTMTNRHHIFLIFQITEGLLYEIVLHIFPYHISMTEILICCIQQIFPFSGLRKFNGFIIVFPFQCQFLARTTNSSLEKLFLFAKNTLDLFPRKTGAPLLKF
jgi:hypothetical protein